MLPLEFIDLKFSLEKFIVYFWYFEMLMDIFVEFGHSLLRILFLHFPLLITYIIKMRLLFLN